MRYINGHLHLHMMSQLLYVFDGLVQSTLARKNGTDIETTGHSENIWLPLRIACEGIKH